jgi:hypothetical protein
MITSPSSSSSSTSSSSNTNIQADRATELEPCHSIHFTLNEDGAQPDAHQAACTVTMASQPPGHEPQYVTAALPEHQKQLDTK